MSKEPSRQSDPSVIVVLHRAGDAWCAIAASTKVNPPRILDSRAFSADEASRIGEWIDRHRASEVIRVLPSSAVICRTCSLPVAEPEQLDEALRLQAEAQLAGVAPDYRTGMAVLHPAPGETSRTGIIVAWPPSASLEPLECAAPVRFAPDVAALAGLLNGERPTEPLVWADRRDGSLALALTHTGGAAFRATREDGDEELPWNETVGRILAETALGAGHTAGFVQSIVEKTRDQLASLEPGRARLLLPVDTASSIIHRVQDASVESAWWTQFGVAVGALLARTSHLAGLTTLAFEPPRETPSLVRSTVERLSRPATAVKTVVLCLLVLALGPLAFNAARLQVLKLKHGNINELLRSVERTKKVKSMYQELGEQRWTMTKLLADLANNTPIGIELDQVRITHGDSISIGGSVFASDEMSPPEVAALMQRQLFESKMFTDVTLRREEVSNLGDYEFELSAKVERPHKRVEYDHEQDFALKSYRERLYGEPPDHVKAALVDGSDSASALDDMISSVGNGVVEVRDDDERRGTSGMLADAGSAERVPAIDGARSVPTPSRTPAVTPSSPRARVEEPGDKEDDERTNARRSRRTLGGGSRPESGKSVGGGDDRRGGARGREENVPPPVTQAAVDAMSKQEALAALAEVSTARRYAKSSGNSELEDRLKKDFDLLMERVKRRE